FPVRRGCAPAAGHAMRQAARSAWHVATKPPPASPTAILSVSSAMTLCMAAASPTLGHAPPASTAFCSRSGHFALYLSRHFWSAVVRAVALPVVAYFASARCRHEAYFPAVLFFPDWQLWAGVAAWTVVAARTRAAAVAAFGVLHIGGLPFRVLDWV